MKRAYGYIRVSRYLDIEKHSPEVQTARIREYCKAKRWDLADFAEDLNVTGVAKNRPGWDTLMALVQPEDVIVCNEFTRIGRSLKETLIRIEELSERGVEIVSLEGDLDTTTAAGRLQLHILLVLAEFERSRLSERLQQTHEQIAREGYWKGGGNTPLGYSYTPGAKILTVDPEEAGRIRHVYNLRDSGWSIVSIAKETGMNYNTLRKILANPTYIGKRPHKGEVYPGKQESIIDRELWERVQARNRLTPQQDSNRTYLLTGMLTCGDCGGRMSHASGGGRKYYICAASKYGGVRRVTVEEHIVHEWVVDALFDKLDEAKVRRIQEKQKKTAPKKATKAEGLRAKIAKLDASLKRLVSDYYDKEPLLTPEQFREKNAELRQKHAEAAGQLQELEDRTRLDNVVPFPQAKTLRENWQGLTLDEQREALRLFIDKVTVKPGKAKDRLVIRWKWGR